MSQSPDRPRLVLLLCCIIGLMTFVPVQPGDGASPTMRLTPTASTTPTPPGDMGFCALAGTVSEEEGDTLKPLSGAAVAYEHHSHVRPGGSGQTVTDNDGYFSFDPILIHDTDTIIVHTEFPGYEPQRIMQGGIETWPSCQFDFLLIREALTSATPPPIALTPIAHNVDWTPVVQDFDGVDMVLVPAGCFMMGSEWTDDHRPVHEQCFNDPFWIDRTEVTQVQFEALGGEAAMDSFFPGGNLPREQITWFEARDFCDLRGTRLPTEAEWEYAARGPDNLVFPWGNEFVGDYTVYAGNSEGGTAPVGSKPEGMSWVGALDMSGNVWEWVSSLYMAYPYDAADGREDEDDGTSYRVARGGGWGSMASDYVRAAVRGWDSPDHSYYGVGFRCARSYK